MPEEATATATAIRTEAATATRFGVSVAFAAFLGLMAQISFPLPWTPVPFSMMPLALLVAGGYQRPGWAALSVVIYLAAGALGLGVFAEGEAGWHHLFGATAGYLWGFILVSMIASWYMQRRRALLEPKVATALITLIITAAAGGVAVIAWMWRTGSGLESWGVGASTMWVLVFVTVATAGLAAALLMRRNESGRVALNLWLVMLGAIIVLHACGVTVLWLAIDELSLIQAIALGSAVFLPFDIVKAALAVALTLPFVPAPAGADPTHEETHA